MRDSNLWPRDQSSRRIHQLKLLILKSSRFILLIRFCVSYKFSVNSAIYECVVDTYTAPLHSYLFTHIIIYLLIQMKNKTR